MTDPRTISLPPSLGRREYQIDALCGVVNQWKNGHRAVLVVAPTGSGKTAMAGMVAKYALEELERKVLFIAHRDELIEQATNTFVGAFGFATAVEKASQSEKDFVARHGKEPEVVVATVQSLYEERLMSCFQPERFGVVMVDEAHRATGASYKALLGYFPDAYVLGITATPDGATGRLGALFEKIAYQVKTRDLVPEYLVPVLVRKIQVPVDLREIRTTADDYNVGDLAERLSPAIETLCYQVTQNIGERQTVVFTPDVGSAMMVARMFQKMGRKADYVAGEGGEYGISKKLRKERLAKFKALETQIIVCCDLLVEGYDCPAISCVVVARPTKRRHKYCQMVGRAARICPEIGKTNALVLDLDWQQDDSSRDLCRSHTLYQGEFSQDVLAILGSRLHDRDRSNADNSRAPDFDVLKELQEIEADFHQARIIDVKYTGKQTALYAHTDSTPFGVGQVLDIKVRKSKDFDPWACGPATPFQVQKLVTLGISGAEQMNLWGASRLISKLEQREKKGLASHQQVRRLLASGVQEEQARTVSRKEAAAIIAQGIMQQGELF